MPVSKDKTRISVTLSKDTYKKLKNEADKEGRSLSNLISFIITKYLE